MMKGTETNRKLLYVHKKLAKEPKLYLENLDRDTMTKKTPRDGLLYIIKEQQYRETYTVGNDGVRQCSRNRRRSQGDLFRIMSYYYPEITFKEVRELLIHLWNCRQINTNYCYDINKQVFYKIQYDDYNGWFNHNVKDELGLILTDD